MTERETMTVRSIVQASTVAFYFCWTKRVLAAIVRWRSALSTEVKLLCIKLIIYVNKIVFVGEVKTFHISR